MILLRIHLDSTKNLSIVLGEYPQEYNTHVFVHFGFHKIAYEAIDNKHQLPKINLDKLYERDGEVWMFLGFSGQLGEDEEMVYMADFLRIGYIITE